MPVAKACGIDNAKPEPASSLANSRRVKDRLWLRIGVLVTIGFLLKRLRQVRRRRKCLVCLGGSSHLLEDRTKKIVQTSFLVRITLLEGGRKSSQCLIGHSRLGKCFR